MENPERIFTLVGDPIDKDCNLVKTIYGTIHQLGKA